MSRLRLIGIASDQARLERLAQTLCAASYLCDIDVGTPQSDQSDAPDADASPQEPPARIIDIICWTNASVGPEGAELQERAVSLKESNDYLGLLLDDVTVPEAVTSAQDVRLIGWDVPDDQQRLAPLIEALKERIEGRAAQAPAVAATLATIASALRASFRMLGEMRAALSIIKGRLKALGILGVLGFLAATFSFFFGDVFGASEKICSIRTFKSICRDRGWGNVPSLAQEAEWEAAKRGSNCRAFAEIAARGGPLAEEANRRLDLVKMEPGLDKMELGFDVLNSERPFPSEAAARSDLAKRALAIAEEKCHGLDQTMFEKSGPAQFRQREDSLICETSGGGYVCKASGDALCPITNPVAIETCPPPKPAKE